MNSSILKKLIKSKETLIMPDAYDPLSAKLIENAGFKAVQCSGYSFSLVNCIKKEVNLSLKQNLEITSKIVSSVSIPVMGDAEDGYTNAQKIGNTVVEFIRTGASGMNIEDQIQNELPGVQIVDLITMTEKIQNARNAADKIDPDFIINGRTDALKAGENRSENLSTAIKRANAYLNVGADLVFIPYVKTLEEAEIISKRVKGPVSIAIGLPYNINNLSINDLKELNIARISLPNLLIHSSIHAMKNALNHINNDKISDLSKKKLISSSEELNKLIKHF
ncbi:isocitrate lyase/PEP mutase family protein [Methanobacterium alcaliphilum]|uniref:isocitrate lyase/PEP mutase family protein n=1 Tax=Methanobacterium alcaliphilum TaxID=392018 RepID=UPI00200AE4B7|nr:isocitrate lyase/PEP mutase family protein [Methanobacterium alcaliphilum]MCK9152086.1 isocitrate lyase/PEP mutase family protein [Methanobacterium alcaliphilum]